MQSTTPTEREQWWVDFHQSFLDRKKAGPIDLLFLGDSITQGWAAEGKPGWDAEYAPLNAANFGIGGDETGHVLWRLDHGEVDGIAPKLVVLMIGTNNLGNSGHTAEMVIAGIEAVVAKLRAKLPSSKLLLLGVFPRDQKPGTPWRRDIERINGSIAKLANNRQVWFLDLAAAFLEKDGTISPRVMPDYLHLSPEGYARWANGMRPMVQQLMK